MIINIKCIKGFAVLIEKDWVSYGHQFGLRYNTNRPYVRNNPQTSPVFIQWLDAVYQLLHQYPNMFEFKSTLLEFLGYHLYSCQYGTFLLNDDVVNLAIN